MSERGAVPFHDSFCRVMPVCSTGAVRVNPRAGSRRTRLENLIDHQFDLPERVWDAASAVFAANATGDAQVFLRSPAATGTWNRIERPILEYLGNARIIIR